MLEWICVIDGCDKQIRKRDYCAAHYDKLKRQGVLGGNLCKVEGCNLGVAAREYCGAHYSKAKSSGEFNLEKCAVTSCPKQRHNSTHCQMHYNIGRTYSISPERYEEIILEQNGMCAICKSKPPKLVVDHDHATGKVRGLLCNNCNRGIGFLKDDANILHSAAQYIAQP